MNFKLVSGVAAAAAGMVSLAVPAHAQKVVDFPGHTPLTQEVGGDLIENQFVCAFSRGSISRAGVGSAASQAAQPHGGRVLFTFQNTFQGFALRISPQGVAAMQARNPNISYCIQDRSVMLAPPSDRGPKDKGGSGGSDPVETVPAGITFVLRDAEPTSNTGTGKRAWIVDTGIDMDHPDLVIDAARSRNYVTGGKDTGPEDLNGHGTHVAGTIAAVQGNDIGVVGVAPGATVVAIRVLDRRGAGSCSVIAKSIDDLANEAVGDVVNMSLGCPVFQALDDAVLGAAIKGVKFAIAAGNDGRDRMDSSPARVDHPNVHTIAALNTSFTALASWSNYGAGTDWAEPGSSVLSTWKDGGYNSISGTSMASPHAAGLLLLGGPKADGSVTDDDGNVIPVGKN